MAPNPSSLRLAFSFYSLSPYRRFPPSLYTILNPLSRNGATTYKHASSSSKKAASKSRKRVLEKPAKFNPPSHSSQKIPRHRPLPLPPLTAEQEEERRNKTYPGMRFHEGSVMHWFLTTRWVHVWITLSTLIFFSVYTFFNVFLQSSPFVEMLPHRDTFYSQPIVFLQTYYQVWKLTTEHDSAIVKEKRDKNMEDLEKRRRYTKIHGLDHEYWFFGWGLEGLRDGQRGEGVRMSAEEDAKADELVKEDEEKGIRRSNKPKNREDRREDQGIYLDWDGKRRPLKKWFGIW